MRCVWLTYQKLTIPKDKKNGWDHRAIIIRPYIACMGGLQPLPLTCRYIHASGKSPSSLPAQSIAALTNCCHNVTVTSTFTHPNLYGIHIGGECFSLNIFHSMKTSSTTPIINLGICYAGKSSNVYKDLCWSTSRSKKITTMHLMKWTKFVNKMIERALKYFFCSLLALTRSTWSFRLFFIIEIEWTFIKQKSVYGEFGESIWLFSDRKLFCLCHRLCEHRKEDENNWTEIFETIFFLNLTI